MTLKEKIKSLLQEADLYRSQGLLNEAREKYQQAAKVIEGAGQIANKESLVAAISKKIAALNLDVERVQAGPSSPKLSAKAQDLIQKLFSFSDANTPEETSGDLQGAIALAKFGQFERALIEFEKLLTDPTSCLEAAKNILRCHISMAAHEKAVEQYEAWVKAEAFNGQQFEGLRRFLEDNLRGKGIELKLSQVAEVEAAPEAPEAEEEFIDISSIGITLEKGPGKGNMVEFDVNFQSGSTISMIVAMKDVAMIAHLKSGDRLTDIQFYSPIAIFKGTGLVASNTEIKSGPKKGDYCLDIKITGT